MEWVSGEGNVPHLRGGSYFHSLQLGAAEVVVPFDLPAAYATAGLRLVLVLPGADPVDVYLGL